MKEFFPKRSNSLSKQVIMGLFIISLAAMFFSTVPNLPYHSIMQLFSLIVLAFAIALLGRYEFKTYVYAISEGENGNLDLTVTEIKRRSRITVCRVGLNGIKEVIDVTKDNKKKLKETLRGRKTFNYCIDMAPSHSCCVVTEECGEELVIYLSHISELYDILSSYAK